MVYDAARRSSLAASPPPSVQRALKLQVTIETERLFDARQIKPLSHGSIQTELLMLK